MYVHRSIYFLFFFNDTATTEIYTLSLHDALPIFAGRELISGPAPASRLPMRVRDVPRIVLDSIEVIADRKSTRLNSSHPSISYAVFCLKKKKNITNTTPTYISY